MAAKVKIGVPTPGAIDDVWQRRATAAAILAMRELIQGGAIPPGTPISRLSDSELGWFIAAILFAWIKTRSEQATAEGWDMELTLRLTSLDPQPWDAGAVESILPDLGAIEGFDWDQPITAWPKDVMAKFLLEALRLTNAAMIARDVGGGVATKSKSLEKMQRIAAAEGGGPLMTP
jgi:hypothetical protein